MADRADIRSRNVDLRSTVRDKGTILAPTHGTTVGPSTKTASLGDQASLVSRCPKTPRRRLSLPRRSASPSSVGRSARLASRDPIFRLLRCEVKTGGSRFIVG